MNWFTISVIHEATIWFLTGYELSVDKGNHSAQTPSCSLHKTWIIMLRASHPVLCLLGNKVTTNPQPSYWISSYLIASQTSVIHMENSQLCFYNFYCSTPCGAKNLTKYNSKSLNRKTVSHQSQQEDLLDLITALLNFDCFLSTTVAKQCTFFYNPAFILYKFHSAITHVAQWSRQLPPNREVVSSNPVGNQTFSFFRFFLFAY